MKIVFTNCDFELNHTRIIPFNCLDAPYFGRLYNEAITEMEIFNSVGHIPTGVLELASYIGPSGDIANLQLFEGGTVFFNKNWVDFTPTVDWTVNEVVEYTAIEGNNTVRLKMNPKALKDAIDTNTGLYGSTIRGTEQNGCFNWRVD